MSNDIVEVKRATRPQPWTTQPDYGQISLAELCSTLQQHFAPPVQNVGGQRQIGSGATAHFCQLVAANGSFQVSQAARQGQPGRLPVLLVELPLAEQAAQTWMSCSAGPLKKGIEICTAL